MRYRLTREQLIPKGAIKITPHDLNVEIYLYERNDIPYALAFGGKRNKPDLNYRYRSVERREQSIKEYLDGQRATQQHKAEIQSKRKGFKHGYEIGDLLSYSWGYDQTNVDFFQVVGRTDSTVTLRAIGGRQIDKGDGWLSMSTHYAAVRDSFLAKSEPFTKRVQYSENGKGYISMDHGCASLTNETEAHYCSWYA